MKSASAFLLATVLSLSYYSSISGQTASSQHRQDEPPVRLRANEVALDIVVRDKKGRPVRDLKAPDFEVFEDGVRQRIESFRFVTREGLTGENADRKEAKGETATRVPTPLDSTSPRVIALVFDRLSPEARALARKAGITYAQGGMGEGDFAGVFGIDQSLRTIQAYTDNPELVKQAVDRATTTSTSSYISSNTKVRDLSDRSAALDQQSSSSAAAAAAAGTARDSAGASAAGQASGQAAAQQALNDMETRMLQSFETLERDQQGFATINSLLAVITAMQNLPGRKTIIFFSEGLSLPPSVQTKFPSVINAANRANVSIYAIDSAGLRIESGTVEAAREIDSLAARRMQQTARGNDRITSTPYTKALERNEDLLRLDPRSGLGQLADQTGGFLIHDTNDLGAGLRRIDDDMRAYYLVSYIPMNEDYNGKFRHITVKLNRANADAQTRKGYYAVESLGSSPILDYEAPALAASHTSSKLNASEFHAAALDFPATNRPGLVLILAEAPISTFTLAPGDDKKTYNADFSVIALVRDQTNQVVQKVSRHYPLSGPIDKLAVAKKGDVLFYREIQLPPGHYTVEFIAYDGPANKAGVRTTDLEVSTIDESKPRLSSVVVLKRAERITADEQKVDQPFHFGELVVYPNLGEAISKSAVKQLAFFLTAWPARDATESLKLTVEILQKNRRLAQTSAQLPPPDEQRHIKYASSLPLDNFQPGDFELKVTVGDGKNAISRSTLFTIKP